MTYIMQVLDRENRSRVYFAQLKSEPIEHSKIVNLKKANTK